MKSTTLEGNSCPGRDVRPDIYLIPVAQESGFLTPQWVISESQLIWNSSNLAFRRLLPSCPVTGVQSSQWALCVTSNATNACPLIKVPFIVQRGVISHETPAICLQLVNWKNSGRRFLNYSKIIRKLHQYLTCQIQTLISRLANITSSVKLDNCLWNYQCISWIYCNIKSAPVKIAFQDVPIWTSDAKKGFLPSA